MKIKLLLPVLIFFLWGCKLHDEVIVPKQFDLPALQLVRSQTFTRGKANSKYDPPEHNVTIDHDYLIGTTEINNLQFAFFLNDINYIDTEPMVLKSRKKFRHGEVVYSGLDQKDVYIVESETDAIVRQSGHFAVRPEQADKPVANVTYFGANAFCEWLTAKSGAKYRLPTEAEWELACMSVGDKVNGMPGDVWEWCSDWCGEYPEKDVVNPVGSEGPESVLVQEKIVRGGGKTSIMGKGPYDTQYRQSTCSSRKFWIIINRAGFRVLKEKNEQYAQEVCMSIVNIHTDGS